MTDVLIAAESLRVARAVSHEIGLWRSEWQFATIGAPLTGPPTVYLVDGWEAHKDAKLVARALPHCAAVYPISWPGFVEGCDDDDFASDAAYDLFRAARAWV